MKKNTFWLVTFAVFLLSSSLMMIASTLSNYDKDIMYGVSGVFFVFALISFVISLFLTYKK